MANFKSIKALGKFLRRVPVQRRKLRKYSWLPDVLRLEGSIVGRIIGPVLTVTLFAVGVATASEVYGYHFNLSNNVRPTTAVGRGWSHTGVPKQAFIVRTRGGSVADVTSDSTSYDRYYEARKDFGTLTSTVRNLSRLIWVHVMVPKPGETQWGRRDQPSSATLSTAKPDEAEALLTDPYAQAVAKLTDDKIRACKLLLSFVYSVMHHLRNEPGSDYEDYEGVLPVGFKYNAADLGIDKNTLLHRYATYAAIDSGRLGGHVQHRLPSFKGSKTKLTTSEPEATSATTPLLQDDHTTVQFKPRSMPASLPLPLIIAHEMGRLLYKFKRRGYIDPLGPGGYNGWNTLLSGMVDQLTNLERIATTPIPISYGIHLKQCVSLYLFALPFTLITVMGWKMVPLVTLVAFTLMGIEGIANEIEMPFGKKAADLPLDQYCAALRSEVEYLIERLPEGPEEDVDPFDS